jgi:hypothetical protein
MLLIAKLRVKYVGHVFMLLIAKLIKNKTGGTCACALN